MAHPGIRDCELFTATSTAPGECLCYAFSLWISHCGGHVTTSPRVVPRGGDRRNGAKSRKGLSMSQEKSPVRNAGMSGLGSHSTHLLKPSAIHYLYSRVSQGQSWQETKQWSKGGCSNRLEHPLFSTFVPLVRSVTPYVIRILNQISFIFIATYSVCYCITLAHPE